MKRPKRASGFTLVELMVALVMLSIGILAVGRLLIFSQRHSAQGRRETIAVTLAEEMREKILCGKFIDLVANFDNVDTRLPATVTLGCQEWATHVNEQLGAGAAGTIQILQPAEDAEIVDGMMTALIQVSWFQDGETRTVPVRFSICRMGT